MSGTPFTGGLGSIQVSLQFLFAGMAAVDPALPSTSSATILNPEDWLRDVVRQARQPRCTAECTEAEEVCELSSAMIVSDLVSPEQTDQDADK